MDVPSILSDPAKVQEITDYLFFDYPIRQADVCLALGTGLTAEESARVISDLARHNAFSKLIISAGKPLTVNGITKPEAEFTYDFLDKKAVAGIPITRLTEGDNFGTCIEKAIPELIKANSAIIVCIEPCKRRALMHFRKQMGFNMPVSLCGTFPMEGIGAGNWNKEPLAVGYVLGEVFKIQEYLAKGFCVPIELDNERKSALGLPEIPGLLAGFNVLKTTQPQPRP